MKHITAFLVMLGWLAGIVIAKGFWSTLFAIIMPLWAWCLIVEKLIQRLL